MTVGIDRRTAMLGAMAGAALPMHATAADRAAIRAPVRLTEMMVMDARTRKSMRLLRDVMGNRLIALNFMFVGCSTICPIQSQLLAQTQKLVARRMGREIAFVSVTLSPLSDTPDKLVRFANAHDAGPGWHFVAGDFSATSRLRQGFDAYAPRQEDHPPVLFIGRVADAQWTRLYGMPRPSQIARELNARIA